jgi:hypothetical protein
MCKETLKSAGNGGKLVFLQAGCREFESQRFNLGARKLPGLRNQSGTVISVLPTIRE